MFTTRLDREAIQDLTDRLLSARSSNLKMVLDIDHRLELVNELNGVEYINDSKSTTLNATLYSLKCLERPMIWLLTCMDHQKDLSMLLPLVENKVKSILYVGNSDESFIEEFIQEVDLIQQCESMDEMLLESQKLAEEGDAVIFSPACSASETYIDFKQRGGAFREAVNKLV